MFSEEELEALHNIQVPGPQAGQHAPVDSNLVAGDRDAGLLLPKPWLGWFFMAALVVALLAGWALAVFMAWLFPSLLGPVPY